MGQHERSRQPDDPATDHKATAPTNATTSGRSTPSTQQVDRMLAAATSLDLGDRGVGEPFTKSFQVANRAAEAVNIHATVSGDSSIMMHSAPSRIFERTLAPFELKFQPTSAGHKRAVLTIEADCQSKGKETLEVPVFAAAHIDGQPLLADQEEAAATAEKEQGQRDHDAAVAGQNAAKIDAFRASVVEVKGSDLMDFQAEKNRAEDALRLLGSERHLGANAARSAVTAYAHQPQVHETLAQDLTERAVVMAGKKLGGALGKPVGPIGSKAGTKLGERLAHALIDVTKADAKGPHVSLAIPGHSGDVQAQNYFFDTQETLLAKVEQQIASDSIQGGFSLLQTELQKDPAGTIAAMKQIGDSIQAQVPEAADVQTRASAACWIDYVAQSSVGTVDASAAAGHKSVEDKSTIDIGHANERNDFTHAPSVFGGLVDVMFDGSVSNAADPIQVRGMRLHGVSKAVLEILAGQTLASLPIPVRALGFIEGDSAGVTVVRDEAGNVAFTDASAPEFQHPNWLGRHIGELHKSDTSQLRGAQRVIAEVSRFPLMMALADNDSND